MKILILLLLSVSVNASVNSTYKNWDVWTDRENSIVYARTHSQKFESSFMVVGTAPKTQCLPSITTVMFFAGKTESVIAKPVESEQTWRIDNNEPFQVSSSLTRSYSAEKNRMMQISTFQVKLPTDGTVDSRFLTELLLGTTLRTRVTTTTGDYQYESFSLLGSNAAINQSIDICLDLLDTEEKYFNDNDAKYFRS